MDFIVWLVLCALYLLGMPLACLRAARNAQRQAAASATQVDKLTADLKILQTQFRELMAGQGATGPSATAPPAAARPASVVFPAEMPGREPEEAPATPQPEYSAPPPELVPEPMPMPMSMPKLEPEPEFESAPQPALASAAPPPAQQVPQSVLAIQEDMDRWTASARQWLFGGNLVAKLGLLILFIGISFLLKYTAVHISVPIELRLAGIAAAAGATLAWAWRIRASHPGISLPVQGTALAVLILVTFGAFRLYHLLPAGLAFGLLLVFVSFTCLLAVLQDAIWLAIFGIIGGFATPVLISAGSANHVGLFTYCAILNAGIVAIATRRAWRVLNVLGFLCTFVLGTAWGVLSYRPDDYLTAQFFLILFLLFYIAIAMFYAAREAPRLAHYVDGTLVFGAPLLALGLQYGLVKDIEFGMAWSTLAMATLYITLALLAWRRMGQHCRLLAESFLSLGTVFATLAIPFALDARWTSAAWALEGAGIIWVGLRQQRRLAWSFGLLAQAGAAVSLLLDTHWSWQAFPSTLLDGPFLDALLLGASLFASSLCFEKQGIKNGDKKLSAIGTALLPVVALFWYGLVLTSWANWLAARFAPPAGVTVDISAGACYYAISVSLFGIGVLHLARRLAWPALRWLAIPAWLVLAAIGAAMLVILYDSAHLPGALTWCAYGVAWIAAEYASAYWRRAAWPLHRSALIGTHLLRIAVPWLMIWPVLGHAIAAWMLAGDTEQQRLLAMAGWETSGSWSRYLPAWVMMGVAALLVRRSAHDSWPLAPLNDWHRRVLLPAAALWSLLLAVRWNLVYNGAMAPLPYVPLLNPIDLTTGFAALLAIAAWRGHPASQGERPAGSRNAILLAAGGGAYLWFNLMLLRCVSNYMEIAYNFDDLMASQFVQAMLSLVWSVSALILMRLAAQRQLRMQWSVGAALLGVVVLKLFMVDLSNVGGIERIVSFIGAGLLMVAIGYVAPLPARSGAQAGN